MYYQLILLFAASHSCGLGTTSCLLMWLQSATVSFNTTPSSSALSLRLLLAQPFLTGSGCFDWQQKEPHQDDVVYKVVLSVTGKHV